MIVKQILLVGALVNVQRSVWRICILMFGCKGLMQQKQKCHSSATRYLGVSTNFSTNMLSSLKDFKDSLLADSRASSKSSGFITILIPWEKFQKIRASECNESKAVGLTDYDNEEF